MYDKIHYKLKKKKFKKKKKRVGHNWATERASTSTFKERKLHQIPAPPASALCLSINLLQWPRCFSSCCQCAGTLSEWVCVPLPQNSLSFPQPSGSPRHKPLLVSKARYWAHGAGEPNVGLGPLAPHGKPPRRWYPSLLWVDTLRLWVLARLCLCLLAILVWPFLCIFSCRKSVLFC